MFETLPGFREFFPEQFVFRRGLFDNWRRSLEVCGFQEYEGSVLEPLELYIEKSGNEIVEQLFHFVDKGERKVAMRPEMTPTLARMVGTKANALRKPVKWFNIGDHFRYERMQKGRTRCFTQLNVDILGEAGVKADVESIYTLILVCQRLGLDAEKFYIRLSDRDLWLMALSAMGIPEEQQPGVLGVIDKVERSSEEQTLQALEKVIGEQAGAVELLTTIQSLFGLKSVSAIQDWFENLNIQDAELRARVEQRMAEWNELVDSLKALGCVGFYEIDLSIVRGLAYYTGFVFEAFEKGRKSRALAGGGRYDHLVKKLGGPDFPAVGWAMGDVTMMDCLESHGLIPRATESPKVFVVMEESTRMEAMADINLLRQAGIGSVYSYKSAGFGKQFKEANQLSAAWVLVYGSNEVSQGKVNVKNLSSGEEMTLVRSDIVEHLKVQGLGD